MFRKAAMIILFVGVLAGTGYAAYRWNSPDDVPPPFERDQFIEVQIVTAPVRHVAGQREYTQDELRIAGYTDYREEDVLDRSTQILRVFNTGRPQEFQGTADGIEMVGGWGGSRVREDKKPGVTLYDFQFRFPKTTWAISSSERLMALMFAPGRTTLGPNFSYVATIAYQGEDKPTTFVRARWLPEPPEQSVVKLYDGANAP